MRDAIIPGRRLPADHKRLQEPVQVCGFRRDPVHPDANLMTASEVTKILDAGKRAGCTKALSTFGEMLEEHSLFREWI